MFFIRMNRKEHKLRRFVQRKDLLIFGSCSLKNRSKITVYFGSFYRRISPEKKGLKLNLIPLDLSKEPDIDFSLFKEVKSFHSLTDIFFRKKLTWWVRKSLIYLNLGDVMSSFRQWYFSFSNNEKITFWTGLVGTILMTAIGFNKLILAFIVGGLTFILFVELIVGKNQ